MSFYWIIFIFYIIFLHSFNISIFNIFNVNDLLYEIFTIKAESATCWFTFTSRFFFYIQKTPFPFKTSWNSSTRKKAKENFRQDFGLFMRTYFYNFRYQQITSWRRCETRKILQEKNTGKQNIKYPKFIKISSSCQN